MRQILTFCLAALALSGCTTEGSRNVPLPYSITDALGYQDYREQLTGVRFYFGNQPHPRVAKNLGIRTTSQRSNAFGRNNKETCARAFASALLRLKAAALRSGGDAVIDIKSNYRHVEVSSDTQYQCASGALISAVALKGTIVKLR
jgi:uncharacterized protein YbjQ (UPF0145 family)